MDAHPRLTSPQPPVADPARPRARATFEERTAWVLMAAGLIFVLTYHLVPALLAGLLVNSLLHRLARGLAGRHLPHGAAKWVAVSLLALVSLGVATAAVLFVLGLARGHAGDVPAPLARALTERLRRLEAAFEAVVFAQVKISAVNTVLTGIYLVVVCPWRASISPSPARSSR